MRNEEITRQVVVLSEAMAEMFLWAQEVERTGTVPVGTMRRARTALRLEGLRNRREALSGALGDLPTDLVSIRRILEDRIEALDGRAQRLTEEVESG